MIKLLEFSLALLKQRTLSTILIKNNLPIYRGVDPFFVLDSLFAPFLTRNSTVEESPF